MKKLIIVAIVVITWFLLIYNGARAQDETRYQTIFENKYETIVKSVCLNGYLFAVTETIDAAVSITQIFEYKFYNGFLKSHPMKCKKENK